MIGAFGQTFLVDWGMAKAIGTPGGDLPYGRARSNGPGVTDAGSVLGTLPYMSPEQGEAANERIGPASDVYSLGATLYHLLTGRAPFVGQDEEELAAR